MTQPSKTGADRAGQDAWPSVDPRSPDYCYQPCANGLHVCGFHPDGQNFLTIANIPTRSAGEALALFEQAREECRAALGEPDDYVVDLQQDDDCGEDFHMSRQMLERLLAMAPPSPSSTDAGNGDGGA